MTSAAETPAHYIRLWLMRNPRPIALRVYAKDGREFDFELTSQTPWTETAASIDALGPERIECMGEGGRLLRACNVADLLHKEETATAQKAAGFTALQSTDPETQRMIAFAELIERAHTRATEAVQQTVQVAFTQLQEICGSLAQQATAAQSSANELSMAIRNLLIQQAQEAVAAAETPEHGPIEQLAANFLSGSQLAQAQQAAATAAKPTNGKH